jgi:branched-chain amino acid transport system substrate-binding protein
MKRRSILKFTAAALAAPALLPAGPLPTTRSSSAPSRPRPARSPGARRSPTGRTSSSGRHQVNARGGLNVGGTMRPVEIIEYDDQTNPGETIKAVQRLATQDEAHFIIAPYGTGLNIAAAPIFDRYGYPQITSSAITDQVARPVGQFPNMFFTARRRPSALPKASSRC